MNHTALVLCGSALDPTHKSRYLEQGFDACLLKPLRSVLLRETLVKTFRSRSPQPEVKPVNEDSLLVDASAADCTIETRTQAPRWRVLLAEDNVANQMVATGLLQKLGCRIDVSANGREAVELWRHLPYDLILMDCNMPEMDGYEATAEIRRQESCDQRVPIIAITANAMQGDRERCLEAGMDDYISKPINPQELQTVLARFLLATKDSSFVQPPQQSVESWPGSQTS
jgi:CheY-like chemotaxis protein